MELEPIPPAEAAAVVRLFAAIPGRERMQRRARAVAMHRRGLTTKVIAAQLGMSYGHAYFLVRYATDPDFRHREHLRRTPC